MAYERVIPRDLFNDANLLKCIGQLVIKLEEVNTNFSLVMSDTSNFDICQNEDDGSTFVSNIQFVSDREIKLFRPMNNRRSYPLMAEYEDNTIEVFDDSGNLTLEFKNIISIKEIDISTVKGWDYLTTVPEFEEFINSFSEEAFNLMNEELDVSLISKEFNEVIPRNVFSKYGIDSHQNKDLIIDMMVKYGS